MKLVPRTYQRNGARFMLRHPYSALLADPGTGKTVIALMVTATLKKLNKVGRVFVVAPLKVLKNVWPQQVRHWDQLRHLKVVTLHGTKKDKLLKETDADIFLISVDGVKWLAKNADAIRPGDALIIDESTKFKGWSSYRTKELRKILPLFNRRHILTGTPVPENYVDLFPQMYIVDRGVSLGSKITYFRNEYFYDRSRDSNYSIWVPFKGATKKIDGLVRARCFRVSADELDELPDKVLNPVWVDLPEDYADEIAETKSEGEERFLKRQLATGIMTDGTIRHTAKLDALEDLVEALCGQHMIVFFNFHAEGDELARCFKAPIVDGRVKEKDATARFAAWNAGGIPLLLVNPQGCSHGLNLQDGGHHACWFSLPLSGDIFEQANKRLHRMGQKEKVFIHLLLARDMGDAERLQSLYDKNETQQKFLDAMGN